MKLGEPSQTEGDCRVMRTGMLADELVRGGHRVVWWDSCFNHQTKTFRFHEATLIRLPNGVDCQFLFGSGYRRHLSWARVKDHRKVAASFALRSRAMQPPDIIVASYPTVELCAASARYAKARGIPVLVDIRDLVPDSIYEYFHPYLRPLLRIALARYERQARQTLAAVDGIIGITDEFLEWGIAKAARPRCEFDGVINHCYDERAVSADRVDQASEWWRDRGITGCRGPIICFFGVLSKTQDIETIIRAVRGAEGRLNGLTLVLCGSGPDLQRLRQSASDLPNVLFPGQVDAPCVVSLMKMSRYGIAPYRSTLNYVGNIPNKFVEYMSVGLPVISPLQGVVRRLIDDDGIGLSYEDGRDAECRNALIAAMVMSDERYREMRSRVTRLFEIRFCRRVVMEQYVAHIERVANQSLSKSRTQ